MRFASLLLSGLLAGNAAACGVDVERLLGDLDRARERRGVPALALAIVAAGRNHYAGARGTADVASGTPATPATRFRIGSLTKTFTALAALTLVEDGRLDLDARWRDVAADIVVANRWEATHPVRVVHLLEHTAGLLDMTREEFDDYDRLPLAQALSRHAPARVTRWPPGLHAEYSNAGYGLAGLAIERAAGLSYEQYVEQRVLAPLGLRTATFAPADALLATGYESDGRTVIPYWHMVYAPFGGLAATAGDMALFVRMLLARGATGDGRFLPVAAIERLEQPRTTLAARAGLHHGYGLGNYAWQHRGHTFHGHGGDGDGYLAHYGYSVALDCGYFLAVNAFSSPALAALRTLIEDWIVADRDAPAPPAGSPGAALADVTGRYVPATWRFPWRPPASDDVLVIDMADATLRTRATGRAPRDLLVVTGRLMRRADETTATAVFVDGADGTLYLQGGMGNWRRTR